MVNWEYNFLVILYKTDKYIKGKKQKWGKTVFIFYCYYLWVLE